ncbi:hypothetical protein PHJA_000506400 [Phtheirospermum japonicum]|uniref:Uncharacterized protein n=1 Tax=Phtheirospermum japonicum TaxID=374723 RepID=A0A830B7H5_9LAMI|nr:hypothetical protein PHJA_000506400 [Phtheirospermum japonicum]
MRSYSGSQLIEGDGGCRFDLVNNDDGSQMVKDNPNAKKRFDLLDEDDEDDGYQSSDAYVSLKEKETRGPTMCKDVHGWTLNYRKPILLNGNGQPIGLDDVTLRQYTRFYGSIARDPDLAPLDFLDCRYVPNKDNIWDYVKEISENKPPSEAVMYKETHKRIKGRKYKTPHMEEVPYLGKNRLLGRCTKKEKQPSKSSVLIPDDFLLPYKAQLFKDAVGEVMKLLNDRIPSETLASVASSPNGHTFGDVNNNELCQVKVNPIEYF